jgi:hypothetical protein
MMMLCLIVCVMMIAVWLPLYLRVTRMPITLAPAARNGAKVRRYKPSARSAPVPWVQR